jgi:hypothetical protein
MYPKAAEAFLSGLIDWIGDDIKCVLVDTDDYAANFATDEFLEDIAAGARVATSANLGSKTATLGVLDAADTSFPTVTGDPSEAVVVYQDTGDEGTSRLLLYIDTATGLPQTPNGSTINLSFSDGADKICRIVAAP